MGCPGGVCTGYELLMDLDFDTDGSGAVTSTDAYPSWMPIGGEFTGVFDGNGRVIRRLTIIGGTGSIGLFGEVGATGTVRDLGLEDAAVSGVGDSLGTLAGQNWGMVVTSYALGGTVTAGGGSMAVGSVGMVCDSVWQFVSALQ